MKLQVTISPNDIIANMTTPELVMLSEMIKDRLIIESLSKDNIDEFCIDAFPHKTKAIKGVMKALGFNIKESKEYVEKIWAYNSPLG